MKISFPQVTGVLRAVPVQAYDDIILSYVSTVSKLPSVLAVIQIGSVSVPGVSDIDLIVVFDDSIKIPSWNQVSLKVFAENHPYKEIIAHDIIAIPQSVADYAEAYFYIDRQVVRYGSKIGGKIKVDIVRKLRLCLALEYSIFSIESIVGIYLQPIVEKRLLILLLSTSRHTARLALDEKIISREVFHTFVNRIEEIRQTCLSNCSEIDWHQEFMKFMEMLADVSFGLTDKIGIEIDLKRSRGFWSTTHKKGMLGIVSRFRFIEHFNSLISLQKNRVSRQVAIIIPVPENFQIHLLKYIDHGLFSTNRELEDPEAISEFECPVAIRTMVIKDHWDFIRKSGFMYSSGKAYCGYAFEQDRCSKTNRLRTIFVNALGWVLEQQIDQRRSHYG